MQPEDRLRHYHHLLLTWQKSINLVSPATIEDAWNRHFEDSMQLASRIPDHVKTICDIGSGAGFPALVLAILRSDIHFHLVESDTRKCAFLQTVSRETECKNVTIHNDRIEHVIGEIKADMVTARALASLRQLIAYVEPLWCDHPHFIMVLPKGVNYADEIADAQKKYQFDVAYHPSRTDPQARILTVGKIAKI